jgi:hypothetical protein
VIWIMENLGRKNKKRGDWPRFAWDESWQKPASAGYRPFSSETKKKPLNPCGVVRGVITKVPFSLLLGAEGAILSAGRRAQKKARRSAGLEGDSEIVVLADSADQWNCSSSVEPVSAVTLDLPPWMTVVTSSK